MLVSIDNSPQITSIHTGVVADGTNRYSEYPKTFQTSTIMRTRISTSILAVFLGVIVTPFAVLAQAPTEPGLDVAPTTTPTETPTASPTLDDASEGTAAPETAVEEDAVVEEPEEDAVVEEPEEDENHLARILQGLSWGTGHQEVLDHYRAEYLTDYRADIAGMRDTLRIDEIRRFHNERFVRAQESHEVFSGTRTGYEASVLGGEVAPGNDESLLTVRTDNAQLYYVFASDRLFKVAVAYNSSYLGGLSFEAFLEQVERRYGPALSTEMGETATGVRYLARARWEEDNTRLRIENQSNLFGTFIMVFTSTELEERVVRLRGSQTTGPSGGVVVSDLVGGLGSGTRSTDHGDIADQIIGAPTEVQLHVPEAAPVDLTVLEPETAVATEEGEEGEAEEGAEEEETTRPRSRDDEEEEEEEEGITIY